MKLNINGDVNRTFCQNLCLIFFPGAKFPENEPENSGLPEVYIDVHEENGIIVADAVIASGGTRTAGHGSARICDYVSRDRAVKTSVGSAVLEAGGKLNGTLPPWGILTGVRPAKIAAEMRKRGLDREGIVPARLRRRRYPLPRAIPVRFISRYRSARQGAHTARLSHMRLPRILQRFRITSTCCVRT